MSIQIDILLSILSIKYDFNHVGFPLAAAFQSFIFKGHKPVTQLLTLPSGFPAK